MTRAADRVRAPRCLGAGRRLLLTRKRLPVACGVVAVGSSCKPGGWLHTSASLSDGAASSAVHAAARLTCCATLLALSLSSSSSHALSPEALHARSPFLGSSVVVHILSPRVSADREDFDTSDSAGVDEDDHTRVDFAKAETFINKPRVDKELRDFGPDREGFREAGFVLLSSSSWEYSFFSLSSLLTATSVLTSSFLSRRTRISAIRRISCSS